VIEQSLGASEPGRCRRGSDAASPIKATDDYQVVFSWAEIFNSPAGDGIIVYFRKNGLPLGNEEGGIALFSTRDTLPGPRDVKWLNEIEVRLVAK
jgi:hypothetical protein